MSPLNIAASIAAQVAAVIGARRATRNRRNRAARVVNVGGFTVAHNSWLIRASQGHHGPDAQWAAVRELAAIAAYDQRTKEAS